MPVSDYINVTELIDQPWDTILGCFIDLFGTPFYLIPVSVIGVVIYIKNRNMIMVSMYLLVSCGLLSGASFFTGHEEMILVYVVLFALGLAGLFYSLLDIGR